MPDAEIAAVTRAFNAAFGRMCSASSTDELADELSNMLHHTYRLGEVSRGRWRPNKQACDAKVQQVPGALGAFWIRTFDTHEVAVVTTVGDLYIDYYTNMFGVLVWLPRASMPFATPDNDGRYRDYDLHLDGKAVLSTLRSAFDGLAAMQ